MFRKKNRSKKRTRAMLSAYTIIMILIVALGIMSHVLPKAQFTAVVNEPENSAEVPVGPGEWEGEVPRPEGAKAGEAPELPAGQVPGEAPAEVGDAVPVARTVEDGTIEPREPLEETVTVGETTTVGEGVAATDTAVTISEEVKPTGEAGTTEAAEPKVYDTKEACEEENAECTIVDGSGVVGAELYQVLISPILGFENAIDVCIFVMVLGGFLAVVARTKALETGIKLLVKKLHGKEYLLILLLMLIFSVFGTTYGFLEESVGFYVLIAATMFAAGMDPLVGVATILLGAGSGRRTEASSASPPRRPGRSRTTTTT